MYTDGLLTEFTEFYTSFKVQFFPQLVIISKNLNRPRCRIATAIKDFSDQFLNYNSLFLISIILTVKVNDGYIQEALRTSIQK